jgi:FemAB-related protein (PEP-CTERM system-associated)
MIRVTEASDSDHRRWEDYLRTTNVTHHAFSWHWRSIIRDSFRHTPYYLFAESEDSEQKEILGILPLYHVKSMLFGSALVSMPYLNSGGILASTDEAFNSLLEAASELSKKLQVDYVELRHRGALTPIPETLSERTHKVSMVLPLKDTAEELFSSFKPKLRSQIRRPSKSGIYAQVSTDDIPVDKALSAFFSVFSEHMRDLGTPVFPKKLFWETHRRFGENCRIITIWSEGNPVAAGITIRHQDTVEIPWASALRRYNKQSPNMLLYWEAIKTASNEGAKFFDFGRSSYDTGTQRFKQQWGATPVPLHWYYHINNGEIPDINPSNPKYAAIVACWRKLPLPLANTVGPWLTRSLP